MTKEELVKEYRKSMERTFNLYIQIIEEYDTVYPKCVISDSSVKTSDGNTHMHTDFIICGALLKEDFDQFYDLWFQFDEKCRKIDTQ